MKITPIIRNWALNPDFLRRRMAFISGPRQIGKTTLVTEFLKDIGQQRNYYNWDTLSVKRKFAQNSLFFLENIPEPVPPIGNNAPRYWVVFDEFHKHPKWKELLKGYYDEFGHFVRFIVCGGARLDTYRKSGESLLGRYFLFRMFPLGPRDLTEGDRFSISNVWNPSSKLEIPEASGEFREAVGELYNLTGFPEPFVVGTKEFYNRWKDEHIALLTTEEIRDLSRISDIFRLQILASLLAERVGSPLSINNLAQTLSVSHRTVSTWLDAFEQVYLIFRLAPYTTKLSRAVKKEKKLYLWDWGLLEDPGRRFENFIAVQLIRSVSAWREWGWGSFSLHFVRTKDGKEADFLVVKDGKPILLVEVKVADVALDRNLLYFKERLNVPLAFQVVLQTEGARQVAPGVFVLDAARFLALMV